MSLFMNILPVVITANYNSGKYFPEYLDGLLGQTKRPSIVVICDDCSTDNSVEIIKQSLKRPQKDGSYVIDNMLFFLTENKYNGGPAVARNKCLDTLNNMGLQDAFVFVNDIDDVYLPQKIEKTLNVFEKYPYIGMVYSDYYIRNDQTNERTLEYKEIFSQRKLSKECIVSNNSAYHLSLVNRLGGYDNDIRGPEDYDLWIRISEVAPVYHIPEPLYEYRLTGQNITITTPSEKFAKEVAKVHKKQMERRNVRV